MKVKFTLLRAIMARADYLLHLIAGAAIAALVLAIAIHFLPWGSALAVAATVAFLALIGKEIYDSMHPDTNTAELMDVISGLIGIAFVAVVATVTFLWPI